MKFSTVTVFLISASGLVAQTKPNIILIMTDQQTADAMSNRGNPNVKTPAMDRLASDGVTFTNAYCSYPLSGPSRASIITGKMPVEINVPDNEIALPAAEIPQTLGFQLSRAGYECLYAGKWHIPDIEIPDADFGFRKISGMNDITLVDKIKNEFTIKRDKPLFLVVSFLNPHEICEYARSQPLISGQIEISENTKLPVLPNNFNAEKQMPEVLLLHKQMSPKLYPTNQYSKTDWKNYLYTYYRLVERVDNNIGSLIDELKKNNLYDNSLIVFTSDHGDGVAAHRWNQKRALFEETIHVPFIVKPPLSDRMPGTKDISETLVNIGIDIYPTICNYAQAQIPSDRNGLSIKSIMDGVSESLHSSVFIETLLDGVNVRGWCVIEDGYKYVCFNMFKNKEQLFNLKKDPGEKRNLIGEPGFDTLRNKLRATMLKYAKQTNDKMLQKELLN